MPLLLFSSIGLARLVFFVCVKTLFVFLAHLSRWLKGELIVYRSIRRPLVRPLVRPCVCG